MRWRRVPRPKAEAPRVVVVGAGFGGLAAVAELGRAGAQVILIDQNSYSTFQPLLYQVATAGLNPGDVAFPVRVYAHKHGARFRLGELTSIDTTARRITLADGGQLDYDYLILATGVSAAFYNIPGAAENTIGLYTRRDALALRNQIMSRLERLGVGGPDKDLNFVIVGGGATGVELAGALAELHAALDAAYPDIDKAKVHTRLVEMAPELLGPFEHPLRDYTRRQLLERGVDVRLSAKIREVLPGRVLLEDGEDLPSDVTVWAAGVAGPTAVSHWSLTQGRGGRIMVGPDLRAVGQDRIFAVGDISLIEDHPLPQLAAVAIQSGRHAGRQVARLAAGLPTEPFRYHDKGTMATIGRRSAVVELAHGPRMRGTLAWLAWLGLHLVMLLGNRNRLSALINLAWRYVSWRGGGGLIAADDPPGVAGAARVVQPPEPAGELVTRQGPPGAGSGAAEGHDAPAA
ncbi:MAG TPA: NAD(P)/FAD-dependent oxidoreductase [Streptosporangiaceae bacterium]|nr:NAD(P)/FAD-dependent oxidoreductase [Streptosporangiaceae bacterium]